MPVTGWEALPADAEEDIDLPAGGAAPVADPPPLSLDWGAGPGTLALPGEDDDPALVEEGRFESDSAAALFVSDLHMSDGIPAGDDFLEDHLLADATAAFDRFVGNRAARVSRAGLFSRVVAYALARIRDQVGPDARLDLVLNGDIIDVLEMAGRGGAGLAAAHHGFLALCAGLRAAGHNVVYCRGNHDPFVPKGPWVPATVYRNDHLRILAEHGDRWDPVNWPPGYTSEGSKLVLGYPPFHGFAALETTAAPVSPALALHLLSGIDNVHPFTRDSFRGFFANRTVNGTFGMIDTAFESFEKALDLMRAGQQAMAGPLVALHGILADPVGPGHVPIPDAGAREGALGPARRGGQVYADHLMVQGHTHIPAAIPGVFYNTGSWTQTLRMVTTGQPPATEILSDIFPALLAFERGGKRAEEYVVYRQTDPGPARAVRLGAEAVNLLRKGFFGVGAMV